MTGDGAGRCERRDGTRRNWTRRCGRSAPRLTTCIPFTGCSRREGKTDKGRVQAGRSNAYCYQRALPRQEDSLIARTDDPRVRAFWRQRWWIPTARAGRGGRGTLAGATRTASPRTRLRGLDAGARLRRQVRRRGLCALRARRSLLEAIASPSPSCSRRDPQRARVGHAGETKPSSAGRRVHM